MTPRAVLLALARQLADDAGRRAAARAARAELERREADAERAQSLGFQRLVDVLASEAEELPTPETWRERIWRVPPETRLSVTDTAEALDCSRSFLYHDANTVAPRIPHRRTRAGGPVYLAGELRSYIAQLETLAVAGVLESAAVPLVRRLRNRERQHG